MKQSDFLDLIVLAERLHRQFLDMISLTLDELDMRDINDVRALLLLNIGDAEMTVSELLYRGCYLGTNVSYNLGKLTAAGYVTQKRSPRDKRVIMVRNSEKGLALCAVLRDVIARHLAGLGQMNHREEDLHSCRQTLRSMQRLWDHAKNTGRVQERPTGENGASQPQTRAA